MEIISIVAEWANESTCSLPVIPAQLRTQQKLNKFLHL